ncbi:MAG: coproporphyrinogen III oxidase, partial [Pseudomonadota bacterium]
RHNLVYWRYGDYAGVGPGAHGRVALEDGNRIATVTEADPAAWLTRTLRDGAALVERDPVPSPAQADEMMLMGLRLAEGIDPARYAALAGRPLPATQIEMLRAEGLVTRRGHRLAATPAGRPVLNAILRALLT